MQLLPSLLFGISASLDALLVGISYGLRGIRIRTWQNLVISFVALLGTCLSSCAGSRLLPLFPGSLAASAGSIILILLGTYYIAKKIFTFLSERRTKCDNTKRIKPSPELPTIAFSSTELPTAAPPGSELSAGETLLLSLTLSLNNIGIGLSASMAGLQLLPAAVMTFGCSALFLLSGNQLGRSRLLRLIGSTADLISGLLLICLGVIQLVL